MYESVILRIIPLENLPNLVSAILKGANVKRSNKLHLGLLRLIPQKLTAVGKHLPPQLLKDIFVQL
ncbi:unnamed protein product [Tuber aestivum]|uniref:Uncharacterized protein n=1 Tax=Tuber aestivum TaxID=59557 RepID=A0A292Q019_9PEZI|nr:unnamed protein product [Tuber aestivum]